MGSKSTKKKKPSKLNSTLLLLLLILSGVFAFYFLDLREIVVETPAGSVSVKKGDVSQIYKDTLTFIKNIHLREIDHMKEMLENLNEVVKNPEHLNQIKRDLRTLINKRSFHVDESNRLLNELRGFRFKKEEAQKQLLTDIFRFLSGDNSSELYEDFPVIASQIIGQDKIRVLDSTIVERDRTIATRDKTIRGLRSQLADLEHKFAALEYELEEYKTKAAQLASVAAEKGRIEQLYNDLLVKTTALENRPPVVIRDTIVEKGDTVINHVTEQNIRQYRTRLRNLEKQHQDLLEKNENYQKQVEEVPAIRRRISIDAPFFYPVGAGLRKRDHTYRLKQIDEVVFEFEIGSLVEKQDTGKVLIEIRFGIPVGNSEYHWKKKTAEVEIGRIKKVYLSEIELGTDENGKQYTFKKGVYYLSVFNPAYSKDKEICKLHFAAK